MAVASPFRLKRVTGRVGRRNVSSMNPAGMTISTAKTAKGYAIAYGPDGKPRGFVRAPNKFAAGFGMRYDAAGRPQIVRIGATPGVGDVAVGQRSGSPSPQGSPTAAPPPPKNTPLLPDEQATGEYAQHQKTYGNTLGGIVQSEDATSQDFGLNLKREPDQVLADGTVVKGKVIGYDPNAFTPEQLASNPFSKAATLQRSYQDNQRSTDVGFAARGHLYSGGRIAQQGQNDLGFEGGKNALFTAFQNMINGYNTARTGAYDALTTSDLTTTGALRDRRAGQPVEGASPFDGGMNQAKLSEAGATAGGGRPVQVAPGLEAVYDNGRLLGFRRVGSNDAPTPNGKPAGGPKLVSSTPGRDSKGNKGKWNTWSDGRKVFVKA